jgi:putative membrane protein insertion efficiency factor
MLAPTVVTVPTEATVAAVPMVAQEATVVVGPVDRPAVQHRPVGASGFAERFILTYKENVAPALPSRCRYKPTCSEYALESYRRYGFVKATLKTGWRLLRCNPLISRRSRIDLP